MVVGVSVGASVGDLRASWSLDLEKLLAASLKIGGKNELEKMGLKLPVNLLKIAHKNAPFGQIFL